MEFQFPIGAGFDKVFKEPLCMIDEPKMKNNRQHDNAAKNVSGYFQDFACDPGNYQGRRKFNTQFTTNAAPEEAFNVLGLLFHIFGFVKSGRWER